MIRALRWRLGGFLVALGARLLGTPAAPARCPPRRAPAAPTPHGPVRAWPPEDIARWLTPPEPDRPRNGGGRVEIPDVW